MFEKNGARNLGIIRRIALSLLKFVQTCYKISLNLIRTSIAFDFENGIENVFKLLDVEKDNSITKSQYLNSCVYPDNTG